MSQACSKIYSIDKAYSKVLNTLEMSIYVIRNVVKDAEGVLKMQKTRALISCFLSILGTEVSISEVKKCAMSFLEFDLREIPSSECQ